jgi:hypothetical protein
LWTSECNDDKIQWKVCNYLLLFYNWCLNFSCNTLLSFFSIIRTTHVTGTFTDIGVILGRLARGKKEELWKLKILCPLAAGFLLGGILAGCSYRRLGKYSLIASAVFFFFIFVLYVLYMYQVSFSHYSTNIVFFVLNLIYYGLVHSQYLVCYDVVFRYFRGSTREVSTTIIANIRRTTIPVILF